MPTFQTSPGTRDILPPHARRWRALVDVFADITESAGYECVIPPLLEDLGVFLRLGEATDVVTKEMYDFIDKGDRHVALRPEQTAGVCRAFAQHRPPTPWKVWYSGPNFRYEKPQAGRYRQFDQVGIEVLGSDDPLVDVEVISVASHFFARLGLREIVLSVNSLGNPGERASYVETLRGYLAGRSGELSDAARLTLERNPLRVLDSKRPEDAGVIAEAPLMSGHLGTESRAHFAAVRSGLDALSIPHRVDDRLVRGLDYYRHTTFEFASTALEGAQNAVGGGGRYDGLVEALGGPPTGGVGFAIGVDRTLLACDAEGVFPPTGGVVEVFVVDTVDGLSALEVAEELRAAGYSAGRAFDARSMKSQMKAADRSGARLAVIVGHDEARDGTCTVRDLSGSEQSVVRREQLVESIARELGARTPRRALP